MNYTIVKKLPDAEEIIQQYPLSEQGHAQIAQDRQDIENILTGVDKRMLCIVGPCSAWPYDAVLEYAAKLKTLSDEVKDKIKIVMRVYIQKPRTVKGWTGPVNQPDPYAAPDITEGITYCRSLMVKIIDMGLPIADEAVFTHNAKGFIELLSWVAIGARSVEDQEHRIFASAIGNPVGMKNSTTGSIEIAVNGILSAQNPHTAVFHGNQVQTGGNPFAHLVLRGSITGPNYDSAHLLEAKKIMEEKKVKNAAILIDASHDNSLENGKKNHARQPEVLRSVMQSLREHTELRGMVKGFMVESFLKAGSQKIEQCTAATIDRGGLSITDPCLSWEDTKKTIKALADEIA